MKENNYIIKGMIKWRIL